jgi:hypothetical protein
MSVLNRSGRASGHIRIRENDAESFSLFCGQLGPMRKGSFGLTRRYPGQFPNSLFHQGPQPDTNGISLPAAAPDPLSANKPLRSVSTPTHCFNIDARNPGDNRRARPVDAISKAAEAELKSLKDEFKAQKVIRHTTIERYEWRSKYRLSDRAGVAIARELSDNRDRFADQASV